MADTLICSLELSKTDGITLQVKNEKGKIVKERDHLMDATRYLCTSGIDCAISEYIGNRSDDWEERQQTMGPPTSVTGGYG